LRRRFVPLLALLACALTPVLASAQVTLRNMELKSHWDEYTTPDPQVGNEYNSCWSYVHGDGREYAVIGTAQGTAIYNVTDPVNSYRVAFIPGRHSGWRNMKSYREWIYVTNEGAGNPEGMQIISMANPENPVLTGSYTATFARAHTMHIDTTRAMLFINGARAFASPGSYPDVGTRILSLANPAAPVEVGQFGQGNYPEQYAHDSFQRGTMLYLANIISGKVRVINSAVPGTLVELTSWTYPGAFTHNLWTNDAGTVLYVTDEVNGEPLKVFDISDVFNPVLANQFTSNPDAIIHNAHVLGDELYLANYTEGVRILDISDPLHPAEFATADSYPGASGGYFGVWEVCPYFPSGTVIASDMQTGLYVYRPARDYGIVRVKVIDADTQQPVAGIDVSLSAQGDSLVTPADGIVQFGPSPGAYTVLAEEFGWTSASANVNVTIGSRDTVTLAIRQKATANYSGTLRDAVGLDALDDSDVELRYTPLSATSNIAGQFTLNDVPDDIYRLLTHSPGHIPSESNRRIGPGFTGPETIDLQPAPIYDDLEVPSGWTVGAPGDDAVTGIWVRVEPLGTGQPQPAPNAARETRRMSGLEMRAAARGPDGEALPFGSAAVQVPGDVQPEFDRTPGSGEMCFVTGQGTNPSSIGQADVDNGRTSLTTPAYDLSGMADPHVGWWQWFYSTGDVNDWFAVRVSNDNGTSWTDVDTLRGPELTGAWKERSIRVADYVTPTSQVKVRFVAADLGGGSIVECAVDDLIAWDDAIVATDVPGRDAGPALRFRAPRPNPAAGEVALTLELPATADVEIGIFDVTGRLVRTLHRGQTPAGPFTVRWNGDDAGGRRAPAGLYFARARAGTERAQTRFVRVE
jgi:choice-of-anchor B domain-containing protein